MENIQQGAELLFQTGPLLWLLCGVVVGFIAGAIPGFSGANAAALTLPLAIGLPTGDAIILIGAVYAGSMFAGSIPAILVNAPGEAGSAATALDGYPLAKAGRAEYAIGLARMASAAGGVIAGGAILLLMGPMAEFSLKFGAREMFVVALFGLLVIATVTGKQLRKGLVSAALGLLIAAMSANHLTGEPRFTMGFLQLFESVPFVPAVIGLFAITQMFVLSAREWLTEGGEKSDSAPARRENRTLRRILTAPFRIAWEGVRDTMEYPWILVRSAAIGVGLGVIPGVGTSVANFISYGVAKRLSKTPEQFGHGSAEGVIASEACDNGVCSGSLVPTLALGVPGSATAAIILASLYTHGIQPGPRLLVSHVPEVYGLLLAMIVSSLLILPLGIVLASPMAVITRVRVSYLVPSVLVLSLVGTYTMRYSFFDISLTFAFGVLGFLMVRTGYPVVPLVLGLILGPLAESSFLQAWQLGNQQISYFFGSRIAIGLWAMFAITVLAGAVGAFRRSRQQPPTEPPSEPPAENLW